MKTKDVRVGFRLSETERDALEEKASKDGVKLSKYLRNIIRNMDGIFTLTDKQIAFFQEEFANITRLGSNVHQVARRLNIRYSNNEKGDDDYYLIKKEEIEKLQADLAVIGKDIVAIKNQLGNISRQHKVD